MIARRRGIWCVACSGSFWPCWPCPSFWLDANRCGCPLRLIFPRGPEAIRFATWNVHYIWLEQQEGRWGLSGWEDRKAPMDATLKALEADIIGFQEMESFSRRGDGNVNLKREFLLEQNPQSRQRRPGGRKSFHPRSPSFTARTASP